MFYLGSWFSLGVPLSIVAEMVITVWSISKKNMLNIMSKMQLNFFKKKMKKLTNISAKKLLTSCFGQKILWGD